MQTPSIQAPLPVAARFNMRVTAFIGLVMCLFDLIIDECTIWVGGAHIQSSALISLAAKPLAQWLAGAAWADVVAEVYGALWLAHYLVFMLAFWASSRDASARPRTAWLLALQALAALLGNGQLTLGVAAQIAYYYELRAALPALLALFASRVLGDLPLLSGQTGYPIFSLVNSTNYLAYQLRDLLVVFAMGYIARLAWQSRERLAAANAELRATERKLAEVERDAERMRIARDLHDTVGHQLTAINLHLDLGMRRTGAETPTAIRTARELAAAALSKLRVAVSRESSVIDDTSSLTAPPTPDRTEGSFNYVNLFAWFGLGICLYALACDQAALWIGHRLVLTFESILPICRWLARFFVPADADVKPVLHLIYSCSWLLFYAAFGTAFWHAVKAREIGTRLFALWWVQIVLAVVWHGQYMYAVLPQMAYRLPLRRALPWFAIVVAASAVAVGPYLAGWSDFPTPTSIARWYFPLGILRDEVVFFVVGLLARTAGQQRVQLATINTELHEARVRLAETARLGERLRIAGELHNALGHELAALNLQLELGMRQGGERLAASVGVAQQAGRQLFDSIKNAIERDKTGATDFAGALNALCAGVPQPQVQLTLGSLPTLAPELAHCLYNCVQEGITNVLRHAQAGSLDIDLRHAADGIVLLMSDDGHGMRDTQEGNGLRGMRARVEQLGGSMRVGSAGNGCHIEVRIPLAFAGIEEQAQEET